MEPLNFAYAIQQVGKAPCDKFNCHHRERCANQLLACQSFAYYVQTGRAIHPNADPMNRKANNQAVWSGEVNPTREIFDSLDAEEWGPRVIIHHVEIQLTLGLESEFESVPEQHETAKSCA